MTMTMTMTTKANISKLGTLLSAIPSSPEKDLLAYIVELFGEQKAQQGTPRFSGVIPGRGPQTFRALRDTPSVYAGQSGKVVAVKSEETGLEFVAAGSGSGSVYVPRGDISSWDWTKASLTQDGAWHDLDCSGIVDEGTQLILFKLSISATASNKVFTMRKNGNSNSTNDSGVQTQVANVAMRQILPVICDANAVVEYYASPTTWNLIDMAIVGWFK